MRVVMEKAGRIQNKPYFPLRCSKVSRFLESRLYQQIDPWAAGPAEAHHMPKTLARLQLAHQSSADAAAGAEHHGNSALGKRDS